MIIDHAEDGITYGGGVGGLDNQSCVSNHFRQRGAPRRDYG
jgi:hypothetical protein